MGTKTQAERTETGQSSPIITVGGDTGAGLTKLVLDSGIKQTRVRLPSKILEVREELHDILLSKEGGHFYYHKGDRKDLIGREFLTGELANWKAPTTHIRLSDDPASKTDYALHMILGALGTLPYRSEWNLFLVLSIHNAKVFRQALSERTNGTHFASFNGKDKQLSKVNLTVSLVVPEGAGSYAYCVSSKPTPYIDRMAQAIGLDLGTSTVINTVFAPGGAIVHRKVLDVGGCVDLLDAIATDREVVEFLGSGRAANNETIRQGIEDKTFQYGTRQFNFKDIYNKHAKNWLADRIRLTFKEVEEWRDAAQSFTAWGGGTEMSGVAAALKTQGIFCVPDGSWANAYGLQRMAEARAQQGI